MGYQVGLENEAGHILVTCSDPEQLQQKVEEDRDLVCRLLNVNKNQESRSNYELWGAYKNDSRPPHPHGGPPGNGPPGGSPPGGPQGTPKPGGGRRDP